MTGRGPCSAMRLSICERNYASPNTIFPALSLGHQERDVDRTAIDCVGLDPARQASYVVAQPVRQLRVGRLRHFAKVRTRIGHGEAEVYGGARV